MGQKQSKSSTKYRKNEPQSSPSTAEKPVHTPNQTDKVMRGENSSSQTSSRTVNSGIADSSSRKTDSVKTKESPKTSDSSKSSLESYFSKYKDATEDAILAEGVESFCEDLGVNPTDFIVLVLAWKFQASEMCRFTREEFMNGCRKLKAMDAKGLRQQFPDLIKETKESEKSFKELYQFTFTFGLDHSSGQRALPTDMAVQLWDLLFTHKKYPILTRWYDFLQNSDNVKTITKDTWNMFLPFIQTMKDNLDNYDESEAWPTLFDDFVEYEQEREAKQ